MPARIDYEFGYKFKDTRITFFKELPKEKGKRVFIGVCECGTFLKKKIEHVRAGNVQSCGCLLKECLDKHNERQRENGTVHDKKGYDSYRHMISRCYNEHDPDYYNYGACGIKVCERWLEPDGKGVRNFLEDMGEKPKGFSLDRIDVYGDYTPENCKWSDKYDQAYNKKFRESNKTGKTGVMEHKDGGYVANIGYKGEKLYLGWFRVFEEAVEARIKAEIKYRGRILGH